MIDTKIVPEPPDEAALEPLGEAAPEPRTER